MKLITGFSDKQFKTLVESVDNGEKRYYIEGIFMQADVKNKNQRIYPKSILEEAVGAYNENKVLKKCAWGELNHPDRPNVDLNHVSHRITELKWDGNDVWGKAMILDTPTGQIVQGLLKGDGLLGVSSRGVGSVTENSKRETVVESGYILNCVDIVADPSAPSAFVNGILEGFEFKLVGDGDFVKTALLNERLEDTKKIIKRTSKSDLVKVQTKLFEEFLRSIS